jgi:hypothetical protein
LGSKIGLKKEKKSRSKQQIKGYVDATNNQDPNVLLAVFRRPRTKSANDAGEEHFFCIQSINLLKTLKYYNNLLQLMVS